MLTYHFGPLRLASLNLRVRVVDTFGDPALAPEPETPPRLDLLDPAERGYLLRSQPLADATRRISVVGWAVRYVAKRYNRHFIDLSMGQAAYLRMLSAKTRATLNRKARRFAELSGREPFQVYATAQEMAEFYIAARQVSALTYQEKLYGAGLPESECFRDEMIARAEADLARGYVLFAGDSPVSYLYCPVESGGRMLYAYLGFDPTYASHSPGTVLQWLALQHIFSESRFRQFDFLEGEGPHKKLFATAAMPCADIFYLRKNLSSYAIAHSHLLVENTGSGAVALAKKTGIYTMLRRRLRGQ